MIGDVTVNETEEGWEVHQVIANGDSRHLATYEDEEHARGYAAQVTGEEPK